MAEPGAATLDASGSRRLGLAIVFAVGGSLYLAQLAHAFGDEETIQSILLGVLIPAVFSVAILSTGLWLWRTDLRGEHTFRIGLWCVFGVAVVTAGAALTVLYEAAEGVTLSDPHWLLVNAASGGGVVGIVIGVYETRQRRARARASRREQQLTVLARLLRHDIRNAANVISGRAELLETGAGDAPEQAGAIQEQAMELVEVGNRAKRVEAMLREDEVEPEAHDLTRVVEESLATLRRDYPEVAVEAALPDGVTVRAHPLLESAVSNVIDNAAAHNDAAEPRVEISIERVERDGRQLVDLCVADNGPGIPETEVDVLARGYETPLAHSAGLGLWVVNWVVTASGGDIEIETAAGGGSTVHLLLPAADA